MELSFKGLLIQAEFCHEGNLSESGHVCVDPSIFHSPFMSPACGSSLVPGPRMRMASKGSSLEAHLDTI